MNNYKIWIEKTADYPALYEELVSIENDKKAINDRFYRELEFGTGGLRGIIGAGPNRMNVFTVSRATLGLGDYISKSKAPQSVVIAYDSRNMSCEFAKRTAEILSSFGITVYIFDKITPTPVLSYAVRELKAGAGIVITASHNPKEYNGYKVYNEFGCQITDNSAKEITAKIKERGYFDSYEKKEEFIKVIGDEILDKYLTAIKKLSLFEVDKKYAPKVVYTPLNGTGNIPVRRILAEIGISEIDVVKEQELPDKNFTTCPYPNPEEKDTLELAIKLGNSNNAELVLATDPDADRLGIAVRNNEREFVLLNGNETGMLIMDYILARKSQEGTLGKNPVVIKTIVSTDIAFSIAEKYGATVKEVLTGFKYIGEAIDTLDNFVMGMEESYGYLIGAHARDKDAVSAAMMVCEMYTYYKQCGMSLYEKLLEIYKEHGIYVTDLMSKTYAGESGAEKMKKIIASVRRNPSISYKDEIFTFTDFNEGINGLPKSDVLRFKSQNVRIIIRPSGTEPKIKIYFQVSAKTASDAKAILADVKEIVQRILD